MSKFFYYLVLIFLLVTSSCKKDNEQLIVTTQAISVTLKVNEQYQYSLGSSCDECGLAISRQATHYEFSKITPTLADLNFIYTYKPALNYVGTDEIEIKRSAGSDGSSPNNIITLITIKFTITN